MITAKLSSPGTLQVLLVLGRVSNLPTVWSNCLAAWLLAGGGSLQKFTLLCSGASLLYTGGMFLNDAFDVDFDRQYRQERPIISGRISARKVWLGAAVLLLLGWLVIAPLGKLALIAASLLLGAIVIYDAVHKHTALAPLLMAACRFLLYMVAASAAREGVRAPVVASASALAAYIVGLSYLARKESTSSVATSWSSPLLFAPIAAALLRGPLDRLVLWLAAIAEGGWVFWCLGGRTAPPKGGLSRGVAGLLAGIVLVDWLAATAGPSDVWLSVAFIGLFVMALLSQRFAPAT